MTGTKPTRGPDAYNGPSKIRTRLGVPLGTPPAGELYGRTGAV